MSISGHSLWSRQEVIKLPIRTGREIAAEQNSLIDRRLQVWKETNEKIDFPARQPIGGDRTGAAAHNQPSTSPRSNARRFAALPS